MKCQLSLLGIFAVALLLTTPVRSQEQEDEPKPGSIDAKAKTAFMISCGSAMSGIVLGFEWFALGDRLAQRLPAKTPERDALAKYYKEMHAYPKELIAEFSRKERAQKSLALRYFTDYVLMLRSLARLLGDDGKDVLPVALGKHTEPMNLALQILLKTAKDEDRLRAAAVLLDLVPEHVQARAIVAAELKAKDKGRRQLACELAGTLRLTQPDILTDLVAAVKDQDAEVRQAAAQAVAGAQ